MIKRAWEYIAMCDDKAGFVPVSVFPEIDEDVELSVAPMLHLLWEMLSKYGTIDIYSRSRRDLQHATSNQWELPIGAMVQGPLYDAVRLSYRSLTGRLLMSSLDLRHLEDRIRVYIACRDTRPPQFNQMVSVKVANGIVFNLSSNFYLAAVAEEIEKLEENLKNFGLMIRGKRIEIIPTLRIGYVSSDCEHQA